MDDRKTELFSGGERVDRQETERFPAGRIQQEVMEEIGDVKETCDNNKRYIICVTCCPYYM